MDLFGHTQTLKRWINSCTLDGQLDLSVEVVQRYIVERFTGKVDAEELKKSIDELHTLIGKRRTFISPVIQN